MMSVKMERVLENLSANYMPFTLLSKERLSEVVNIVRFVELRQGEIMQIRGGEGNDYLYVVEGHLELFRAAAEIFRQSARDVVDGGGPTGRLVFMHLIFLRCRK